MGQGLCWCNQLELSNVPHLLVAVQMAGTLRVGGIIFVTPKPPELQGVRQMNRHTRGGGGGGVAGCVRRHARR